MRRIDLQKNYCARTLVDVAKLWRRAKFVPEDAKDRESLYVYRDFLRIFEGEKCKRPLMLKNGGVRCMTREEFDNFSKLKPIKATSILFTLASVLVAIIAITVNFMNNTILVGVGMAVVLPVVQIILMLFLKKLIKEKDVYRDGIFMALKENCVNFVTITKAFIVVDAYPEKFGKNTESLYIAKGEPSAEQIVEVRNYIALQRQADRNFETSTVNNQPVMEETLASQVKESAEIESAVFDNPISEVVSEPVKPMADVAPQQDSWSSPIQNQTETENLQPMTEFAVPTPVIETTKENSATESTDEDLSILDEVSSMTLVNNIIDDMLMADVNREVNEMTQAASVTETKPEQTVPSTVSGVVFQEKHETSNNQPINSVEMPSVAIEQMPMPTESFSVDQSAEQLSDEPAVQPLTDEGEPDEDDFSLEAIGRALDAEIAKRNAKK